MMKAWLLLLLAAAATVPDSHAAPPPKNKAAATREGLLQLTTANWTSSIGNGAWLVEFFSPYCHHCKEFFPVWDELVTNKEYQRLSYPDAPFTLAQVDCISQNDLCVQEKVPHFPRLTLYRDGKQYQPEYQGVREYTALSAYVDKEAEDYRKVRGVSNEPHPVAEVAKVEVADAAAPPAAGTNDKASEGDKQKQADPTIPVPAPAAPAAPVAPSADQKPKADAEPAAPPPPPPEPLPQGPNPLGKVLSYGSPDGPIKDVASLEHMLSKDGGDGACFVKFFAPWCPHCKAMANAFREVAEALKGRVNAIEVDCERNKAVCSKYGIQSFPTLRMYNEGEATEYQGGRGFEAMRTWALKAGSASGVRQISAQELGGIGNNDDVLFLYLHQAGTPEREIDAVTKASRILLTTPVHVYRSSDEELITRYKSRLSRGSASGSQASIGSLSGLLAFKDHNLDRPTAVYFPSALSPQLSAPSAAADVAEWLDKERYATVSEVTGNSFNDIINNKQGAPVVLAALSDVHHSGTMLSTGTGASLRDEELEAMRDLAKGWRDRGGGGAEGTAAEATRQRQERVLFAWIDADRWASAIATYYHVKPKQLPKLLLADGARLEHYDLPSHFVGPYQRQQQLQQQQQRGGQNHTGKGAGAPKMLMWIDKAEVYEALDLIWQGKGAKPHSSRTYLDRSVQGASGIVETLYHHSLLSFFLIVGVVGSCLMYLRSRADRRDLYSTRLPIGKVD